MILQNNDDQANFVMSTKTLIAVIFISSMFIASAEDQQAGFDAYAPVKTSTEWKPNPALRRELLSVKPDQPTVSIGKADLVVSGPLVQTFRRSHGWSDLSLGRKILALPVINLFVPKPMPSTPGGGRYFQWGESSQPWIAVAQGAVAGDPSNAVRHEALGLISISR